MSNKKEILFKSAGILIIRVAGYSLGFLFFWIIANKYGAKIQGIFSIAFLFLSIGVMISKLGIGTSLVKWIASEKERGIEKAIVLKSSLIVLISSVLLGGLIYFIAPLITKMYDKPDTLMSLRIAGFSVPFLALLDVLSNYFKGKRRTNIFGLYFHFGKFLLPLIILGVFYYSRVFYSDTPMTAYFIGIALTLMILIAHLSINFRKTSSTFMRKYDLAGMLNQSFPMMISSSIIMIMGWSDVFILGFFVSEENIGVYATAIKVATIVSFTYNAIATIAAPKIALFFNDRSFGNLKETISFSAKMMFLCGVPIFIVLFIFPEFFLNIFGPEYLEGKTVMRILLLAQLINVLSGPVGPILNMTNNQRKLQMFIIISLIFNLSFSLALVQKFGLEGVAFGSAIGMIIWNILGAIYIKRKMNLQCWIKI